MDNHIEIVATIAGVLAQETFSISFVHSPLELSNLIPKLSSDVDVRLACSHGKSNDQGSFHKLVGVVPHDLSIFASTWL